MRLPEPSFEQRGPRIKTRTASVKVKLNSPLVSFPSFLGESFFLVSSSAFHLILLRLSGQILELRWNSHIGLTGRHVCWTNPTNITFLLNNVRILLGEVLYWSHLEVKGLQVKNGVQCHRFWTIFVASFSNFRLLQVIFATRGREEGDSEGSMEDI